LEFDFLPNLPKANLDDRTFDDLVDECLLRIPRYCPEWTDHNLSDPGVTLIELFAWLTDQMLMRFNQVPRRNYIAFLELLGVRLMPPAPASTEVTFYLSGALDEPFVIPLGTEVATERTENEEAIVFSTDLPLTVGVPQILHLLTASVLEEKPQALRDRFSENWALRADGEWSGNEQAIFDEQPSPGNCFYLVFNADQPLEGVVLAVNCKGAVAAPTGIDPNQPPRRWEAWDGEHWVSVLLKEADDRTRGFSFADLIRQGGSPQQGADVVLHLPLNWPVIPFTSYQGRWLRCVYHEPATGQPRYDRSARLTAVSARAIGGAIPASHAQAVSGELVGTSDGTPGQTYQLQNAPILARRLGEYLQVTSPAGLPQTWKEVNDFADSGPEDLHYTLDSLTGTLQFGPLIRGPGRIQQQTRIRSARQQSQSPPLIDEQTQLQHGAVPPRGAEIRFVTYRTGGGHRGNVQSGVLRVLKSAVPYVSSVINYPPARSGADAESLEQAAVRVPRMLRNRDRAVTAEDFETLAFRAAGGGIAFVRCAGARVRSDAGTVRLLVVPEADRDAVERGDGIHPQRFAIDARLRERVLAYLDERKLLGVQVVLQEPEYVGVQVQTEVALEPRYDNPTAQAQIIQRLRVTLYRYLNPLTGGPAGKGWPFGRPVYTSDIVALLQKVDGVRYLGAVLFFAITRRNNMWTRKGSSDGMIDPGPEGLICSWMDSQLRSSHIVNLIGRNL
jgi:predicted phage baseplate assembly protein